MTEQNIPIPSINQIENALSLNLLAGNLWSNIDPDSMELIRFNHNSNSHTDTKAKFTFGFMRQSEPNIVYVSSKLTPDSFRFMSVLTHELQHVEDTHLKINRASKDYTKLLIRLIASIPMVWSLPSLSYMVLYIDTPKLEKMAWIIYSLVSALYYTKAIKQVEGVVHYDLFSVFENKARIAQRKLKQFVRTVKPLPLLEDIANEDGVWEVWSSLNK
jgi:hypothetical protein